MKINFSGKASLLLGLLAMSVNTLATERIDFDSAKGYLQAQRKVQCSLEDNKPVTYMWQGRVYSRVPGERDQSLFQVIGMNVRQCVTVIDSKQREGYRMVSREIMLYLDPVTGKILRKWNNPWTGGTLDVIHVANDPVNSRPDFGIDPEGNPKKFAPLVIDGTAFMTYEIPLFYKNPLAGDYQKYVGGTYHATEIFDFTGDIDDIADLSKDTANISVAWVRIAPWLPWMEMNGRVGLMYANAMGKKLQSWDDLPDIIKQEIRRNYPEYQAPPSGDDDRSNETSWTYFKKKLDKKTRGSSDK